MEADIRAGVRSKDILEKHNISAPTLSKIKKRLSLVEDDEPTRRSIASGSLSDDDPEWYFTEILEMIRDGEHEHEIYKRMIPNITNRQFREAMEWARKKLDE